MTAETDAIQRIQEINAEQREGLQYEPNEFVIEKKTILNMNATIHNLTKHALNLHAQLDKLRLQVQPRNPLKEK